MRCGKQGRSLESQFSLDFDDADDGFSNPRMKGCIPFQCCMLESRVLVRWQNVVKEVAWLIRQASQVIFQHLFTQGACFFGHFVVHEGIRVSAWGGVELAL